MRFDPRQNRAETLRSSSVTTGNLGALYLLGPLAGQALATAGKGSWNTQKRGRVLGKLNYVKLDGPAKGRPRIETAIDAAEVILALAPETNGQVAVKAWEALGELTGRDHTHRALNKEDEKSASAIFSPAA